ncbi:McrC family protein [Peredibacter starrii]|uniref:5-methylcytosine-specific restriction enzyme subunit McrC n=1 Tax=Peredibacter starrii TaxID=28202 RepID=A0AAX4HSZ3_9BACT|nr:hypothetical protein [Peredibacter starrii]WPU66531.1 hypothetical protein SOO65_07215 [Peredibacter starrii]
MKIKRLTVFEHNSLRVGEDENNLSKKEFEALCLYHSKSSQKFFSIEYNKIRFKHFVGAIQVGSLMIEVLPKVDHDNDNFDRWHHALINILQHTKRIRSYSANNSNLEVHNGSLIDLYIEHFLNEVDRLLHSGLRKKYRVETSNLNVLKGRIDFGKHLKNNLADMTKFNCAHEVFNWDHDIHSAIRMALNIVIKTVKNQHLVARAKKLNLYMPENVKQSISIDRLDRIKLDRTTKRYEVALTLSSLLIRSFCPMMTAGKSSVLAIMFDMNHLYEDFIFNMIRRCLADTEYTVERRMKKFWKDKVIKPDMLITNGRKVIIMDTKWKIPQDGTPTDADLKQVFVYNNYFDSPDSVLLYPWSSIFEGVQKESLHGEYYQPLTLDGLCIPNSCRVETISFFDSNDKFDTGKILDEIKQIIFTIIESHKVA